ncbi:helix-turn-helix domain-containing protein [uncultured Gordonia sp.]|jgi:predicted site-specific integrase-resolvase|uniref:helix-turn-helix domain-containing protein n=1 Tax=uncultured Gordonia sp. TaxID=198437 RepID=UPI0026123A26|nr:helix-turn-helix domain-containing protein [uncultured Gordonia sp.]
MQPNELDALGVSTDLTTAARALGISKSTAYASARAGTFPVRVIRVGSRYVVPTADLRAALGLGAPQDAA